MVNNTIAWVLARRVKILGLLIILYLVFFQTDGLFRAIGWVIYYREDVAVWHARLLVVLAMLALVGIGSTKRAEMFLWLCAPKQEWAQRIDRGRRALRKKLARARANPVTAILLVGMLLFVLFMTAGVNGWLSFEFPEWLKALWLAIAD